METFISSKIRQMAAQSCMCYPTLVVIGYGNTSCALIPHPSQSPRLCACLYAPYPLSRSEGAILMSIFPNAVRRVVPDRTGVPGPRSEVVVDGHLSVNSSLASQALEDSSGG